CGQRVHSLCPFFFLNSHLCNLRSLWIDLLLFSLTVADRKLNLCQSVLRLFELSTSSRSPYANSIHRRDRALRVQFRATQLGAVHGATVANPAERSALSGD